MSIPLFLTGLVFAIPAIIAGILDYNRVDYDFPWSRVVWVLFVIVVIIFWLMAVWSGGPT